MRELRVSDELKFEEYDGRLYLIMSERPHGFWKREDYTIMFTPAEAASLRDFLNGDVPPTIQQLPIEPQLRNGQRLVNSNHSPRP